MSESAQAYDDMKLALSVALSMLAKHEAEDSRAISDEFVAIAAVLCELTDDKVRDVLIKSRDDGLFSSARAARENL